MAADIEGHHELDLTRGDGAQPVARALRAVPEVEDVMYGTGAGPEPIQPPISKHLNSISRLHDGVTNFGLVGVALDAHEPLFQIYKHLLD